MVEFEDVKGKAEEEPFNRHIVFSTGEETAKVHILLGHGKGSLRLNGTIDAQQAALIRRDTLLHFIPLAEEIFVHIEGLGSLFQWLFAVAFADTFFFTRTTAAVFTAVNGSFGQESRLRFLLFYLCQHEMFSLCANIFVRFGKIRHILPPSWVSTVFLSLFLLMIGWFDIGIGVL